MVTYVDTGDLVRIIVGDIVRMGCSKLPRSDDHGGDTVICTMISMISQVKGNQKDLIHYTITALWPMTSVPV